MILKKTGRAIGISCESSLSRGKRAVGNRRGTNKKGGGEKRITPATAGDIKTDKRLPETVPTSSKTKISASRPLVATSRPKAGVPLPLFWVGGLLGI